MLTTIQKPYIYTQAKMSQVSTFLPRVPLFPMEGVVPTFTPQDHMEGVVPTFTPQVPLFPMKGVVYTPCPLQNKEMSEANPVFYKADKKFHPKRFELTKDRVVKQLLKVFNK